MNRRLRIAIIGPGDEAPPRAVADAEECARELARRGCVVLCGGRDAGVMAAAARGAARGGGLSVGLLPGSDASGAAPALTVPMPTGLGEARNAVLVTAAEGIVVCGMNAGTLAELALALKGGRPVVLVAPDAATVAMVATLRPARPPVVAANAAEAVTWLAAELGMPDGA